MFLGHYGLALGAKRLAPLTSLGTLVLAAQLSDEVWPVLLLCGVEHVRLAPGITAATCDGVETPPMRAVAVDVRRLPKATSCYTSGHGRTGGG
jgi:hypothetical protein